MHKHRSLSTPPLPGACAARHCQGPVIQGQFPQKNTRHVSGCCKSHWPLPPVACPHSVPITPPGLSESEPPISCSFYLLLSGQRTDARGRPTCRDGTKSKGEPQELCEQRREREISPCRLNLPNQLDVPSICGIPEQTTNHPKIEAVDFGSKCGLGVCCMRLTTF